MPGKYSFYILFEVESAISEKRNNTRYFRTFSHVQQPLGKIKNPSQSCYSKKKKGLSGFRGLFLILDSACNFYFSTIARVIAIINCKIFYQIMYCECPILLYLLDLFAESRLIYLSVFYRLLELL